MYPFELDHICSYSATLDPNLEVIGPTPEGVRVNLYITGGEVTGPKLNGKLRPVGADWLTIRTDGVAILNVRTTIETHDQALLYLVYQGVADLGEDGYQKFLDGEPPLQFPLRCAPRFITSHPEYLWVNRLQCLNIGEGDLGKSTASYDVYAIQ